MLSAAAPFLPDRRIRSIATLGPSVKALALDLRSRPRPVVLATLHLALWESQTWLKMLSETPLPEFGIIFRPLDNPSLDAFVKERAPRGAARDAALLSRRGGFRFEALGFLRGNGCVGILFDQNAGMQGALSLLLGRVCSSTELPGVLAAKFGAELRTFYPRRTAFWRVTFESDPVPGDGTAGGATLALNRWLEGALADDEPLRLLALGPRPLAQPGRAGAQAQARVPPKPPRRRPEGARAGADAQEHARLDPHAELAGRRGDGCPAPAGGARLAAGRRDHPPREAGLRAAP